MEICGIFASVINLFGIFEYHSTIYSLYIRVHSRFKLILINKIMITENIFLH